MTHLTFSPSLITIERLVKETTNGFFQHYISALFPAGRDSGLFSCARENKEHRTAYCQSLFLCLGRAGIYHTDAILNSDEFFLRTSYGTC